MKLIDLLKNRRSRYQLTRRLPVPEETVQEIITGCLMHAPSAFNMQSARVVLLTGPRHTQLWDIVLQCLREVVPADKFAPTQAKIDSFAAAYGTVLYLDDTATVQAMQKQYPSYQANFPVWAQQANGMLQLAIWTALAEAGIGASLQHYNPLIDARVREAFELPPSWQLVAQMPFGQAEGPDPEKTYLPLEERFEIKK